MEIVLRWGDTLLDVVRAEDFAVDGTLLVWDGEACAAPVGAVGPVSYELRASTAVEPLPAPRGDRRIVPYLLAAAAVHVVAVMCALAIPAPSTTTANARAKPHRARLAATAPPVAHAEGADDRGHDAQGRGRAMAGASGALGAPARTPPAGHLAIANTGELPQLARAEAIERARHAGILGSTQISPDAFASLAGHDPVTSGFDEHSAEAVRLDGSETGGGFGFGRSGFGPAGGGTSGITGWGTIGTAHSDGTSFGHGWGGTRSTTTWDSTTWSGGNYEYAILPHNRLGTRHGPRLEICGAEVRDLCSVTGALDPAIVRRYVRRNTDRLAYCFEKFQLSHPGEQNRTLLLEFDVDTDVLSATAKGQPDELGSCVTEVIEKVTFPKGATHVAYYLRYHDDHAGNPDRAPVRVRQQ